MGALVTLDVPDRWSAADLPWIITFGPLDEAEEWEPMVCGPYERPHALALAEAVVADDQLMAVVEPLLPRVSAEQIRAELAAARSAAEVDAPPPEVEPFDPDEDLIVPPDLLAPADSRDLGHPAGSGGAGYPASSTDLEYPADLEFPVGPADPGYPAGGTAPAAPSGPARALAPSGPAPDEIRAGFARIAARLTAVDR